MTGLFMGEAAIVTGGASNIGRAIAIALGAEGADVTILDIDDAGAGETVAAIAAAGGSARAVVVDLAQGRQTVDTLRRYLDERGPPHLVVHSAISLGAGSGGFFTLTSEQWRQTMSVGLDAAFWIGRIMGTAMVEANVAGRFVFITSLHAETPREQPHYSATKAGLTMLMKEMARALGPRGIRVNAIAPGYVPRAGAVPAADSRVALRRVGRAEEIAAMALVLLSDRFSSYVTGSTVVVDGGLSLANWITPSRS